MIKKEVLQIALGIKEEVVLDNVEMAKKLKFTLYPVKNNATPEVIKFYEEILHELSDLGSEFIKYDHCFTNKKLSKIFKRLAFAIYSNCRYLISKITNTNTEYIYYNATAILFLLQRKVLKENVHVFVLGEITDDRLPMRHIKSFKSNTIITIVDWPQNISEGSSFNDHFNQSMSLFAKNMTNIVIAVSKEKWILYNFNASHPIYQRDSNLREILLKSFVPKIYAPISPLKLDSFNLIQNGFNTRGMIGEVINEFLSKAKEFTNYDIFPKGKKIDDLPFRNNFFKWIGKVHLDNRNGMSFGFLAKQLPSNLTAPIRSEDLPSEYINFKDRDFFFDDKQLFISFFYNKIKYFLEVPEVWVMTLRSGSDKTNPNPKEDFVMLGLINGELFIRPPENYVINSDYKPSFDTGVIMAHALGNVMIASIIKYIENEETDYVHQIKSDGISIMHWHGYLKQDTIGNNLTVHGFENLHVACSSPQSAIYAIDGKLKSFEKIINKTNYLGDIHIEPHHGTNICYSNFDGIIKKLKTNEWITELGNKYLYSYNNK